MLKVYVDMMSQPSRAVLAFCKLTGIPHKVVLADIAKGLNRTPEFLAINPAGQVPAIEDGDLKLGEAHAILSYLATSRRVADHWYPADLKARAAVDQYLHWHHTHLRYAGRLVFNLVIGPKMGFPTEAWRTEESRIVLERSLDLIETWLTQRRYLAGPEISIADLSAVCEIAQLQMIDFSLEKWPRVKAWYEQIYALPEVVEVHAILNKVLAKKLRPKL